MGLTPDAKKDLAFSTISGLVLGLVGSHYMYDSLWTWVPPFFVALWVGGALARARTAERRGARRLGEPPRTGA